MSSIGDVRTWQGVWKHTRWSPWEKTWNRAIGEIFQEKEDSTFTKDDVFSRAGVGQLGVSRWDSRWASFTDRHRSIIYEVMNNMKDNGSLQKYRDRGLTDDDIHKLLLQSAVEAGNYPVWADPHRAPGELGVYKLFDLDGFVEMLMRSVRAGARRIENIGRRRYLPAKALFPSIQRRAKTALGGVESRPALTDGARDLVRIECENCGNIYATQAGFAKHRVGCGNT